MVSKDWCNCVGWDYYIWSLITSTSLMSVKDMMSSVRISISDPDFFVCVGDNCFNRDLQSNGNQYYFSENKSWDIDCQLFCLTVCWKSLTRHFLTYGLYLVGNIKILLGLVSSSTKMKHENVVKIAENLPWEYRYWNFCSFHCPSKSLLLQNAIGV